MDRETIDFSATVQNAIVNLGTRLGSDPIYPERGTNLFNDALGGRMVNEAWANHSANFAALRTLAFIQNTGDPTSQHAMAELRLAATSVKNQTVTFRVAARSVSGEIRGDVAVI